MKTMIDRILGILLPLFFYYSLLGIDMAYSQTSDPLKVSIRIDLNPAIKSDLIKIKLIAVTKEQKLSFLWHTTAPGELLSNGYEAYYIPTQDLKQKEVTVFTVITTKDKANQIIKKIKLDIPELIKQINQKRESTAEALEIKKAQAEKERKAAEALKIKKAQAEEERKAAEALKIKAEALKIKKAQAEKERKAAEALKIKKAQAEEERKAAEALKIKKARAEKERKAAEALKIKKARAEKERKAAEAKAQEAQAKQEREYHSKNDRQNKLKQQTPGSHKAKSNKIIKNKQKSNQQTGTKTNLEHSLGINF
ncbi:hypothetical protein QUF75_19680 [Desulfococcaceae bacterium HSG7]|nr:hypothetical protein [Desulfococcaceae bacterium HSG7]